MLSTRLARIPLDHLIAEMIAFPLASEAALASGICRLERSATSYELSGPTAELWRRAENQISGTIPGVSIEELNSIRDQVWFRPELWNGGQPIHLVDQLCLIANDFLKQEGNIARPFAKWDRVLPRALVASRTSDRMALWWLVLALPEDLLLASMPSEIRRIPVPGVSAIDDHATCQQVEIRVSGPAATECDWNSPQVESMLRDKGFAESHLHIGAAFTFSLLWSEVMKGIAARPKAPGEINKLFCGPGAAFDEGRLFSDWLLRCALARIIMAQFLTATFAGTFSSAIPKITRALLGTPRTTSEEDELTVCLVELTRGSLSNSRLRPPLSHLQSIYRSILSDLSTNNRRDAMAYIFRQSSGRDEDAEKDFIRRGISYVTGRGRLHNDELFERMFVQYLRLRNLFYRHVVQRPLTPGLQWFIRHFARISPAKRHLKIHDLVSIGTKTSGLGRGLKSFEFRTAPGTARRPDSYGELRTQLERLNKVSKNLLEKNDLEIGLVFHIIKERGTLTSKGISPPHGRESTSDPRTGRCGFRYEDYVQLAYQTEILNANPLVNLLRDHPECVMTLKGIDVCSDELAVPNWVIAPVYRHIRKMARNAIGRLDDASKTSRRFYATAHAGEDFVHLLTGLRNVHEAIVDFELGPGDRLGHGIALGVNPRDWSEHAGHVTVPAEVRLLDLVWAYEFLATEKLSNVADAQSLLVEIDLLANDIFGELDSAVPQIHELIRFRSELSRFDRILSLYANALLDRSPKKNIVYDRLPMDNLIHSFMTDASVFHRGRNPKWIAPTTESGMLQAIQNRLRQNLAELAITVEINPSSNLLIGDMGDLHGHPLWRLRPPGGAQEGVPPLAICVGSDDPLTFASKLPKEYQLLYDVLVSSGLGDDRALRWLDEVREIGMHSRFTR